VHGCRDLEPGHVHDDRLGDVRRQRLDVELVRHVLEHAALLDARRLLGALEVDVDLGLDLLVEADLEQVDVEQLVADRMLLLVLDDHGAGLPADLEVDQGGAVDQHLAERPPVDLEGRAVAVLAAVDHAGHVARAAQPLGRARAALGPVLYVEGGSLSIRHDGWPV
jgi:hypothetical protein